MAPDIFDVLVLVGAALMGWGAEQIQPGAGFLLAGAALYAVGLRGPATTTAPTIHAVSGRGPETR